MSKSIKGAKNAGAKKSENVSTVVIVAQGANSDALNGRVACRTHAMHQVLSDAYVRREALSYDELVTRTRALIGAAHRAYEKLDRTAHCHLTTMKKRNYVEYKDKMWRLTALGASEIGAQFVSEYNHSAAVAKQQSEAKARTIAAAVAAAEALKREQDEALKALESAKSKKTK